MMIFEAWVLPFVHNWENFVCHMCIAKELPSNVVIRIQWMLGFWVGIRLNVFWSVGPFLFVVCSNGQLQLSYLSDGQHRSCVLYLLHLYHILYFFYQFIFLVFNSMNLESGRILHGYYVDAKAPETGHFGQQKPTCIKESAMQCTILRQ